MRLGKRDAAGPAPPASVPSAAPEPCQLFAMPPCSLIMAASDFAALFASVGISFWTQLSFREPLLFSAASCLSGGDGRGAP